MDKTKHPIKMTLRVADDVRRNLEIWAEQHLSTMTTELNRSVRERAQRERVKTMVAAD
jgi:hypothetical protein